jgi:pilus assembly protein CpaC
MSTGFRSPAKDAFGRDALARGAFVRRGLSSCVLFALTMLAGTWLPLLPAFSQAPQQVQHINITLNKSVTLPIGPAFSSAAVGSADIADARPMTDHMLYIQGKKVGTTNVSIYDDNNRLIKVIDIEVGLDTGNLQAKIRAVTGNSGIRVINDNGQVVLSGTATDALAAEKAVNLARAWSEAAGVNQSGSNAVSVINAMSVASPQQVQLKVRFLEVSRDAGRQLGINWNAVNASGTRGVTTGLGGLTTQPPGIGGTQPAGSSNCPPAGICAPTGSGIFQTVGTLVGSGVGGPFGTIMAEVVNKGVQIDTLITALETKGLLQRLAEPNLVALSGDTASFLAGGQFPVPTPSSALNGPSFQYQPFGVQLKFRPTVLNSGIINLSINPTVSELDFNNAVTVSGTTVPSLTERSATTTVELRDGQSFAIAGLLEAHNLRNISQLPWVGSLPVLGALFRSTSYQKDETDLVIIVTPSFVQPAPPGARLATPYDNTVPSNDVDFFLMGQMEQKKKYNDYVATGGGIQGPYGYMLGVMQGPDAAAPLNK